MSTTSHYNLYLSDDATETFRSWRDKMNGPSGSNMEKIDTALYGKLGNPVTETYTITAASWTTLANASPYTVQATATATHTIGSDTLVELLNNAAVSFANYGFAIGSVSGQTITFYALEAPTASVSLEVDFYG